MLDYVKKTLFSGVGLALRSKKEIAELAKVLTDKEKLSREDGEKFLDELMERYDDTREKLEQKIEKVAEKVLEKANIPTKKEIRELSDKIEELSRKISDSDKDA